MGKAGFEKSVSIRKKSRTLGGGSVFASIRWTLIFLSSVSKLLLHPIMSSMIKSAASVVKFREAFIISVPVYKSFYLFTVVCFGLCESVPLCVSCFKAEGELSDLGSTVSAVTDLTSVI